KRTTKLLDRQPDLEVEEVRADDLLATEAPELERGAVPGLDPQLAVEHDDTGVDAAEDRLEERVRVVQLVGAVAELVVHRLELLVRRLELFVHRLELLVRR